jgi:RNA polymerase sigma-70 factor, ECF subfamily
MIAELYTQYHTYVARICFRYVKNQEDAEDLAQEIFVKLIDRIDSFQGDAQLSTWLYRVAANHCLDHLRWKKRQLQLIEESGKFEGEAGDDAYAEKSAQRFVQKVMDESTEEDRHLIFLHFQAGLTHLEIAEMEGVSRVAITKRLAKAQERIQDIRMRLEEHAYALPMAA